MDTQEDFYKEIDSKLDALDKAITELENDIKAIKKKLEVD